MEKKLPAILYLSPKAASIWLYSISGIIITCLLIYIPSLFLATYPTKWIAYFLISQQIFEMAFSFLINKWLAKKSREFGIAAQIISAGLICLFIFLLTKHYYLTPLFFSIFLSCIHILELMISWSCARNAFDFLEYKKVNVSLNFASTTSKIAASIIILFLVKQWGINFLPPLIAVLLLLNCLFLGFLKPLPFNIINKKIKKIRLSLKRYPLFNNLFIFGFVIAIGYTLTDYLLQFQLSTSFQGKEKEIGEFISTLSAISSILAVFLSYVLTKPLLKIGIASLLQILPFYWLLTSLIALLLPNLWTIALISAGFNIFFYNFFTVGRELFLSVFPNEIRALSQAVIKITSEALGAIFILIALIFLSKFTTPPVLLTTIIILSIFLILYCRKLTKNYISTLKEEIFLKRFSIQEDNLDGENSLVAENIVNCLNSTDLENIRFGYSLLDKVKLTSLPPVVIQHLFFPDRITRIEAIKAITKFNEQSAFISLLFLLEKEKDSEVKWWIINALAHFHPEKALPQSRIWLNDHAPEVAAGAIRILLLSGNYEDIQLATTKLHTMLKHPSSNVRQAAARVFTHLPIHYIKDYLTAFIRDEDDIVSSYAIETVYIHKLSEFLPVIINRLTKGGIYYIAKKLLLEMEEEAIPLLTQAVIDNENNIYLRVNALIAILSLMASNSAEQALINLAYRKTIFIKQIVAFEAINHARHHPSSNLFRENAIKLAKEEADTIIALKSALQKNPYFEVKNEITSRIHLAEERYLYWLGIFTSPFEVFNLVPLVLHNSKQEQGKALELLINSLNNRKWAEITLNIFSSDIPRNKLLPEHPIENYFDSWLQTVILYIHNNSAATPQTDAIEVSAGKDKSQKHTPQNEFNSVLPKKGESIMDNMQKVFVLRQVELFKNLPGETLMVIAEQTEVVNVIPQQKIFAENDPADGLYIIASGTVDIVRQSKLLSELNKNAFFGELALIDNAPRAASAIAKTDGVLLFLKKETFERIANDLPQILHSIVQVILRYLRSQFANKINE